MLAFSFKKNLGFLNSAIIPQRLSCPNPVSNHHHPTVLQMRESNDIPGKWLVQKHTAIRNRVTVKVLLLK